MSSKKFWLCLLIFLMLSGCAGKAINKSNVILEAENHTKNGLEMYSEAAWNRAKFSFTKALLFYQGIDNQPGVMLSHINLAEVALVLSDYSAVNKHLLAASIISKKSSQEDIQSRIVLLYSQRALKQNQLALAKNYLQPLLLEFDDVTPVIVPNHFQLIAISSRTKIAFIENNDALLWTQRYEKALIQSEINDSALASRLLRFQAILLQRQGNVDTAESNLLQALTGYKNSFFRPGIAVTLTELGQFYVSEGRWKDAEEYFNRAIAVYGYLKNRDKISQLTQSLLELEPHLTRVTQ